MSCHFQKFVTILMIASGYSIAGTVPTASQERPQSTLQQLRDILNDRSLQILPPDVLPKFRMNNLPWFGNFDAEVPDGTTVKRLGYWVSRGGAPDASPNSMPDDVKKGWQESETALQPLVGWLDRVRNLNLEPSNAKFTLCGSEQME
jgi:hypothetical protein